VIRHVLRWFARRSRLRQLNDAKKAFWLAQAEERSLVRVIAGAIDRGEVRVAALREQLDIQRRTNSVLESRVRELEAANADLRAEPRAADRARRELDAEMVHSAKVKPEPKN